MAYLFRRKSDLEKTLEMIHADKPVPKPKVGVRVLKDLTKGYLFLTPGGGIPARSGTTVGSADCTPYYIDSSDNLVELTDNDGSTLSIAVKNIAGGAVSAGVYVQAKECYGVLVVDMEDCS